ncbi:MAG: response regulator [bacterium]
MPKKILIIEDDKILADMYAIKFEKEGYDVIETQSGIAGLDMAKKEKPNVILLDVILPEMDGFTILEEIKKTAGMEKIPIVLLTNLGQQGDVEKGKALGAAAYLTKSNTTPADVIKRVKELIK